MSSFAYVGRRPCGHIRAAMVDAPERAARVNEFIGEMIRDGLKVERVNCDVVRVQFGRCDECDPPQPKQTAMDL